MPPRGFRDPDFMRRPAPPPFLSPPDPQSARRKEATMVPLLLWILGVPGLIIILLLLLGIIKI